MEMEYDDYYKYYGKNYEYLNELKDDELIKIINEMIDFDEVIEAFSILEDRDSDKALELGIRIIENDEGDEFLQATIWDFMFYDYKMEMVNAVDKRKNIIGKYLLNSIIIKLTDNKLEISSNFIKKLLDTYESINLNERKNMDCNYNEFIKVYQDIIK